MKGNALQNRKGNVLQNRKGNVQSILLYLVEKNALCLCSSLKGTSTGPVKPQLFNMVALQEQLYRGQESILHSTQELAGPRMPSVFVCIKPVPQAVYRLCTKAATQLESLQEANHAVFTSVLGCSSFRSIKTRPLSPSTVNEWDIFLQWTAWILK